VTVRRIRPSDEAAYRDILDRTTDEDRYCRFFHVVDHFDPAEVHRYVERRDDTIGMIAEEHGLAFGCAHAVAIDERSAELAIVVAHDARRRGVGLALVRALIDEVHRCWTQRLFAISLANNVGFAKLARATGFSYESSDSGTLLWRLAEC